MVTRITSLQNPRVKQVVRLRDRRHREREGLMLVEGQEELGLALSAGARPLALFHSPELISSDQDDLLARAQAASAETIEVPRAVFEKMAYRENPDGWLAVLPALRQGLANLPVGEQPLFVIAESIEKPGNLGALLRSADAAGVDGVIVCDPTTDINNPNVVRSSRGALFTVPVVEATTEAAMDWARRHGIAIVAATPQAALAYTQADLRGPAAIAVGTEHAGLSQFWLEHADLTVRIPMFGRINSLNVATAASLLLYEALRQRGVTAGTVE